MCIDRFVRVILLNFTSLLTNDLLKGKVQLSMANAPSNDKTSAKTSLGDRVREWVDELVDGVVELMSPPLVPVPVRRRR